MDAETPEDTWERRKRETLADSQNMSLTAEQRFSASECHARLLWGDRVSAGGKTIGDLFAEVGLMSGNQ